MSDDVRRPRGFAWGFVDQVFSSATNFALSVFAGRLLGPAGLGVVAVGFASFILAQSFQRALVAEPLVVATSAGGDRRRSDSARWGLTMVLAGAALMAAILAAIGLALGGAVGRGLLLFAPWLVPALVQDYWRAVLFRDGRGGSAAFNDALWILAMALTAPLAWSVDATWAVLASWGSGAAAGALFGFAQVRVLPARPGTAWRFWREDVWPFGRWLAAEGAVLAVGSQAIIAVLAAVLGTAALGGLRAAQTLFAPLSLLTSAASFPGLPALTRELEDSHAAARRLAVKLSGAVLLLTLVYLVAAGVDGAGLLSLIFGDAFGRFAHLVYPVGAGQLVLAAGTGFFLLLKVLRAGRALLWARVIGIGSTLLFVSVLAWTGGLLAAAWGLAAGTALRTVAYAAFALRPEAGRAETTAAP